MLSLFLKPTEYCRKPSYYTILGEIGAVLSTV